MKTNDKTTVALPADMKRGSAFAVSVNAHEAAAMRAGTERILGHFPEGFSPERNAGKSLRSWLIRQTLTFGAVLSKEDIAGLGDGHFLVVPLPFEGD